MMLLARGVARHRWAGGKESNVARSCKENKTAIKAALRVLAAAAHHCLATLQYNNM